MDELDLLWDEIVAYDPSYVDQYEKHTWRKDILEDDAFFRDMYDQSKERGFASLSNFGKVEDYWSKVHGIKQQGAQDSSFQSRVNPLVSDEMNANDADNVYNPNAEYRGEIGQLPNVVRMLTWKNNKDIINNLATFDGTGIPGFEENDQSENVKRKLMSGKWGLDTQTGALYVLPESQQEAANQEELRLAENIDIRRKKEDATKEEIAEAQEARTAENKFIAVNKWVQTQTTTEVLQSDDGYKARYINSYDANKIDALNPSNKSWMNILQGHDVSGNKLLAYEFAEGVEGEEAIFNENYVNSWWNESTMQDYKNLSPKFFGQGGIEGSNFELKENNLGRLAPTFMNLDSGTLINGEEESLNALYQEKFTELDTATREFEAIKKGEASLMGMTIGEQGYGEAEYMDAAYRYARATQDFMNFYFDHHVDGVSAKRAFDNVEAQKTMAISKSTQQSYTAQLNPNLDKDKLAIKINNNEEKSILGSSIYQIGTSNREWEAVDAIDMAKLNIQSNEYREIYTNQLGELAQAIYTFRGVSGKKGQDAAIAEANSKMQKSEIFSKLKGLSSTYQEIIGRGEGITGGTAIQVIDITTGKPVRRGDSDLSPTAQQAIQNYDTTVQELSSGIFSNNTIKHLLLDLQNKILNDQVAFTKQNVSQKELGAGGLGSYEGDRTIAGAIRDYFGSENSQKELDAMKETIKNFQETGLIDFKHLRHIEGNTPLIKGYNSKINTLRALSEVYLMNFDPILSLENEIGEIDVDFWGDQSSDFGVSEEFKAQAGTKLVKGIVRGLPEAVGIDGSREGLYDDQIQQEFVTSMINDFGIGEDITIVDEETGEDIVVNSLQNELNTRLENVSTFYKVGRQVPTFAVMIAETAAIEFLTVGMGSGLALANIGRRATQMYNAVGIGKKTASVMGGWTKMMLHEAMILEGSNQIGSHAWGRERMPVWSFAIGSSLARSGMTGLGNAFTKFNTNMLSKAAQLKSPMARKWASANAVVKNNPLLVGTPLKAAAYVPKKMLQAGIGTATIKSGELVGSVADVFGGDLSWKQFWDHALDADAFIEMFGTMLVMGTRSGLKDGRLGFKGVMGDVKNLGSTSGTRKFNAAGSMFGLRKLKNYSDTNHKTGKSSWSRLEIDTALNEKIKEINEDPKKTAPEKQKEINNLQEISKFLKLKGEVDQARYDEPSTWDAAYGDKSMSGEFDNLVKRLANGTETNMMDQLKLGQISSWSEGANRNQLIKELMSATGMEEVKAKEYVEWCENLAKVNNAYAFRNGSKNQRKFFRLQSEGYKLEADLEQLKKSHKKGEVNKATLDLESEIIKEKQKKLLEQEKSIIDLEAKETEADIEALKSEITEAEVIETKEGQSIDQAIIDLFETGKLEGDGDFINKNKDALKEVDKLIEQGELAELLEDYGIEVNRSSDYGVHVDVITKEGTKTYTIVDKAKASKAQIEFNEKFDRSKPILAEGKSFKILSNAKRNTLFHEMIHPLVEKAIATNPKFVNDFINTIKKTGEYEAVLAEVKKHPDYKKGYEGSEWLTIYGEMVKGGMLDGMVIPKNRRLWKNLSSKLKKVVNEDTPFKDANFETGNGTREFLIRFAKAKGGERVEISKTVNKGIKEYKDWIAEGKTQEGKAKLLNMSSERLKEFEVEVKDIKPEFNDLYRKYRNKWNDPALELKDKAGWQLAMKEMEAQGMLDKLIYAKLRKVKNTKLSIDQANYVEMVYSEINSLVKGFDAVLQTTSGAGGFFAYVNTYLGRKALQVNEALGAYDFTKSLDQMKESGFDVTDKGTSSTEVYTKTTAKQNAKKMGLKEESIERLNRDMKKLDFDKLIEAYEAPKGRNQTISPFVREFKKQFGEIGTKAVEESMGTTKEEYKAYVENNMEGIVRGLPVGYVSRNFPFLIEGGAKEVTGSTGRHKHWTSGPQSMKVKENFSLLDVANFTKAAVPSRWGAKKKSMAYQIADSYGSKKFLETIEAKNEIEYKLNKAEKDLQTSRLELDNKEITQTEFNSRRNAYMETVKDLLAQGDVVSEFGKAFKPEKIEAGDFTQKINQQIEISNFRRSASLAEAIRVDVGSDATLGLEITDNVSSLLKEKLPGKLLKEGWPNITETQLKNVIKDVVELEGKPIDFGNGFTIKAALARNMAKDLLKVASRVVEGYTFSKGNLKNRIEREAKDLKGDIEKIKADEIADFEIQKTLDRGLEVSESAKLKKQLGVEESAKQLAIEYADLGVEHTMKYLNNKLKDAFAEGKDPAEVVLNWLKYNINHLVSAGGARGHRNQVFAGKPDLFKTMQPILKEYGIDMRWELTETREDKVAIKMFGERLKNLERAEFSEVMDAIEGRLPLSKIKTELSDKDLYSRAMYGKKYNKLTESQRNEVGFNMGQSYSLETIIRNMRPKEMGGLKPGSLKIDGKAVKTDIKTKGQNPKSLKWVMDYVKEIEANPNWAKNNPKKFEKLEKEINEREIESKEQQKALLDEMVEDFKDFKNGEIDKKLLFVKLNSYNTNMTTHLRSSANLADVMIPLKGDKLKNLTVEHKRAADPLLRELTAILNNKGSWSGSGKTLKLTENAEVLLDKTFESYETALIETYEKGEKKTLDKLLEDQYKTDKAFNVIKGGERYGRALNEATFGDPRARAFLNLKEYIKTKDYEGSKYGKEHEIAAKMARNEKVTEADRKVVENIGLFNKSSTKGKSKQELIDITKTADKALETGRKINAKKKKARVFDFDDTVARTKSNVLYEMPNGKKGKITAEEFAKRGEEMEAKGAKWDFSEFNKVVDGKKGPLFDVMKKMKDAAGDRDMFILTARSQESAPAIHEFLKSMGIEIPLENIKGLGNSTGEAKAEWIVSKAAEGYNDFYFADDAIKNVDAVKKALEPIDVKSKVQQARFNRSSENLDMMFNQIIEGKTGIEWQKEFSSAKAKIRGKQNQKRKFWIPASAEDFSGLMDWTLGKGKKGDQQREFYKEVLYKPYSRGVQSLATERVNMMSDFKALKKQLEVPKDLREVTKSGYNKEQAVRAYLWTKTGQEIPGLSKTDLLELNTIIESDGKLHAFAESILQLTKGDGYSRPGKNWLTGTITTDLIDVLKTTKRSKYLQEWKDNVDVLFSKKNLNKLEAAYGPKYREALENILTRMKSGSNRTNTGNRLSDGILDYINGAQGTIMFLNMRSALLQTISAANFLDFGFNNPIKAGKAFANQPQYWKDFMEIMNSDYLVDRRNGLKLNISESEIADAAASGGNKAKAAINYILEKGYLPTRFADSFAIASGGATWYRNRIKDLMKKEGLSEPEAKKKAFDEFREISEKSQQSSDPSKISQQQSGDAGRLLLQFVNTPMQYARLQKSAFKDLINGRGKAHEKIGKILYYGVIQNLWFNAAQSGLFALGFGDFSEDEEEGKTLDTANGMVDSILRGLGMGGMTISVLKNTLMDVYERMGKTKPEFSEVWDTLLQFSPALKSKLTKIKGAGRQFDSKEGRQEVVDKGFSLDNPAYSSFAKVFSAVTNVPLDRLFTKMENIQGALNDENEVWQRIAMGLGWPKWQLQTSKEKSEKRNQELQDYKYSEAKKDQSKYSKDEQVEILKKHGYTDDEIKEMKVEGVRVATIKKAEKDSGKVYTAKIKKEKKKEEDIKYKAYERKPVVKLTKRQQDSTKYVDMNKPEQVSKLDSLGLSKKEIRALQYEADRVQKLLELMETE